MGDLKRQQLSHSTSCWKCFRQVSSVPLSPLHAFTKYFSILSFPAIWGLPTVTLQLGSMASAIPEDHFVSSVGCNSLLLWFFLSLFHLLGSCLSKLLKGSKGKSCNIVIRWKLTACFGCIEDLWHYLWRLNLIRHLKNMICFLWSQLLQQSMSMYIVHLDCFCFLVWNSLECFMYCFILF